ncbi:DUF397 domain-containing protein [Kineosporia sp. A_224]|uniref:DUF397 domain-containing protein n=1 Tax=Kineosporia sp. A_224 TaxID=1962180 RepID=UPI000B4BF550|nr:DUF397 domain-containing protein [Kineosporia sp. A_224]
MDWSRAKWRKASGSSSGGCVEVAMQDDLIGVRDTKDAGTGPVLVFNQREWSAFLDGTAKGEFTFEALSE